MFKVLTFDTNGQHSTWFCDKRDDYSFTITHFPQNSIISTASVWSLIFTPQSLLSCSLYSDFFQRHRILSTKLLNQECLKNRLILSFNNLFILSFTNMCTKYKYEIIKHIYIIYTQSLSD